MALAMRAFHGTASSPKAMGRVLIHVVLLAGVSGSRAQLVHSRADSSESAADTSAGPSPPSSVDLDAFYSADVEKVAAFLGPEMHFHHGLVSTDWRSPNGVDRRRACSERACSERACSESGH